MALILVDDETLALKHLESQLAKVCDLDVVGTYTNAHEAKAAILKEKPSVVFLDIEMPEMSGTQLAREILERLPDIHIVFVTAYTEYAVEAFELNVVDYIVKPINLDRLQKTIERFPMFEDKAPPTNMIRAFQTLSLNRIVDGENEMLDVKWRTTRARSIFALLLHHRKKLLSRDDLLEMFWPDVDEDKGRIQLYSTIYQIRKTLEQTNFDAVIISEGNGYQLHLNTTKYDVEEWEKGLKENDVVTSENLSTHLELLTMYQDDYLCGENHLWVEQERERLRVLALQHMEKIASFYESQRKYGDAIAIYLRIQKIAPFVDTSYFALMVCYSKTGDIRSVEQQYNNLRKMLNDEHGLEPRREIQQWFKSWLKKVAIDK